MRFTRVIPASVHHSSRPLPAVVTDTFRRVATTRHTCSALMVSHHLDDFLRNEARVSCNPNQTRFAAFLETALCGTLCPNRSPHTLHSKDTASPSPQRGSYPPKCSPRQQPCRITATVASLLLPICESAARTYVLTTTHTANRNSCVRHTPRCRRSASSALLSTNTTVVLLSLPQPAPKDTGSRIRCTAPCRNNDLPSIQPLTRRET
jgi:hypothetical protein